jgi:hypothetical protein
MTPNHQKHTEDNCTENQTPGTRDFAEHHDPCLHQYSRSEALHLQNTKQILYCIDVKALFKNFQSQVHQVCTNQLEAVPLPK